MVHVRCDGGQLSCAVQPRVVEHFGVVPAHAYCLRGDAVQVGVVLLATLQRHPRQASASVLA